MSDSPIEVRTDRVGVLVDQLVDGVTLSRLRIDGVTDDELTWEPWPGMWSVRRREDAVGRDPIGPGAHVLDHTRGAEPFAGGPLTTMIWRVGHLTSAFAGRWEWTFGERRTDPHELVDFVPTTALLERLWFEVDRWAGAVEAMTDAQLDEPGFGRYPYGLDREIPFIGIVRWMNRETIHHLAEIALLRDVHAAVVGGGAAAPAVGG